ncbi:Uncharacterized protein dnm_046550 [Desulfonema magnum]|uniref:Uncharacterized protein n=1 Tax=Desulfonema magnum TaxID=45655 RepID=A0A975BNT5_9BACT|nr:Uncharacterized protein dnm_046550 [Desulfonema magnum]
MLFLKKDPAKKSNNFKRRGLNVSVRGSELYIVINIVIFISIPQSCFCSFFPLKKPEQNHKK